MAKVSNVRGGAVSGSDTQQQATKPGVVIVHDERDRAIGIKKLGPVERMRMFKVLGPDASRNESYLGIAALAFLVVSLDGEDVNRPTSELQLEALVQRLGDDGLTAITSGVVEHFGITDTLDQAAVKNS